MNIQPTFFDNERITLADALEITAQSLNAYAEKYEHWAIAFSGGKDSSALVAAVIHLIKSARVKRPKTLTVLMSDTRMELPPLFTTAMKILAEVRAAGFKTQVVMPPLEHRLFVYMLGRGVPPPSNTFRYCTGHLKIALSCGKNNSECGQGWFQEATPEAVADTLAPLLHWRLCHVWDWLTGVHELEPHGFSTGLIAQVYGQDENLETHARTGCVGCNLASSDFALEEIIKRPQWAHYSPLMELRPLYAELKKPENRLRKDGTETRKDGTLVANPCRQGPLTFEARLWALEQVKSIQHRAGVDLINAEEETKIRELIAAKTWPNGWDGSEPLAATPFDNVFPGGAVQPIMKALFA